MYDLFLKVIDDRNMTSHSYHEEVAEEIISRIPGYYEGMMVVVKNLFEKSEK